MVIVVVLAAAARSGLLTVLALLLAIINSTHFVLALEGGAQDAAPGAKRFLRVVTFNVWHPNDRIEDIAKFLSDTDADLVVMKEMTSDHWSKLRKILGSRQQPRRLRPCDPFRIEHHRGWSRRSRRYAALGLAHPAPRQDRGERDARDNRWRASRAAILSQTAICRRSRLGEFCATAARSVCPHRRFQHDATERQARRLHAGNGAQAFQHVSLQLAAACSGHNASALRRHRQCLCVARLRQHRDMGRRGLGSDHPPVIADIALSAKPQ
jgi:hypothetical protein